MKKRDLEILKTLEQFRALSRDHIATLFFNHTKNPTTGANYTLKRLRRDGYVAVNTDRTPYVYFANPAPIKTNGQKLDNYLTIADFYLQAKANGDLHEFTVEPRYKGVDVRPDVFMIWKGTPFWVEIQNSVYSDKVMQNKIDLYDQFYESGLYKSLPWQPKQKPVFPRVWIITDRKYNVSSSNFPIYQSKDVSEFLNMLKR